MAEEAAELKGAQEVVYCQKCGWPPEYCEFRPDFESKCLKWLETNYPDLLPEKFKKELDEKMAALELGSDEEGDGKKKKKKKKKDKKSKKEKKAKKEKKKKKKKRRDSDEESDEDDVSDGGDSSGDEEESKKKVKFASKPAKASARKAEIHIKLNSRNRRKHITAVAGLDTFPEVFGKLKDVAKVLSKRFACSAASVKGTFGPEVHIQGDCSYDVGAFLCDKYPGLPENKVFIMSNTGKKSRGVFRFDAGGDDDEESD